MEKVKAALKHVYGYFTDNENEGDFMKVSGAAVMIVALIRFAASQGFDGVAFGAGAAAFATSKALDVVKEKGK